MRLKIDLFTWVVIGVVAVLVVAAVLTVNLSSGPVIDEQTLVPDDSPAAPVVTAILAVQEGDIAKARAQISPKVLDQYKKQGYDPIANAASFATENQTARRIRIVEVSDVQTDTDGTPVAYVTIAEDNFSGGGLFDRSTWSNQRVIRVAQIDGVWLVDDPNLFY